ARRPVPAVPLGRGLVLLARRRTVRRRRGKRPHPLIVGWPMRLARPVRSRSMTKAGQTSRLSVVTAERSAFEYATGPTLASTWLGTGEVMTGGIARLPRGSLDE